MNHMLNVGEAFNIADELDSSLFCNFDDKNEADQWVAKNKDSVAEFKNKNLEQKKKTMVNKGIITGSKNSDLLRRYLQGHDCAT